MVETADSIIAFHSNNRGHGRSSSVAQQERDFATFSIPSPTPSAEDIGRYSISDAATLLQITAKEGNAVAQRELGTLYLTNPELMDHIIATLSRPRYFFREEELRPESMRSNHDERGTSLDEFEQQGRRSFSEGVLEATRGDGTASLIYILLQRFSEVFWCRPSVCTTKLRLPTLSMTADNMND